MSPAAYNECEQDADSQEQLEEGAQGPSDGGLSYLTDVHGSRHASTA